MDALEAGRDVMVFSDNVPLDQEIALKRFAAGRGLLVMGPDCGTAVVGGLGLGFANVVSPGPVGIVAASGTGCQQLLALLDHAGVGVSSALGVGGRDLSAEVARAGHPRGAAPAGRGPRRRADRAGLQAAGGRGGRRDPGRTPRAWRTPVELALLGPGQPDLTAAAEARAAAARPRRAGLAGGRLGRARRPAAALPARAVRRRHAGRRGEADRDRGARRRTPGTRSSTSATTPTPPAGRTR